MVWMEDQSGHNIPLNQSLIQSKAVTLFESVKAKRSKQPTPTIFEARKGWFMRFKERKLFHNIEVQGKAASADRHYSKLPRSYSEDK